MRGASRLLLAAVAACALALPAAAQEEPGVSLGAFLDLRAAASSRETSFLDGGLGKLRYGGEGGDRRYGFHVAEAALVLDARASEALALHVQANVDPESYARPGLSGVDLVEAYAAFRPALSRTVTLRTKAGIFFPPVSLENDGYGWSATRTLTPSAVDSWIGEEVRATGLESALVFLLPSGDLSLTGALFGWNDPDGALLAWRGWALQDRQTGWTDRLPLPAIPDIGPGGIFARQAPFTAPFREVDGRAGWYAGASWKGAGGTELRALWYDDGGNRTSVERGQYSWQTEFASAGVRVPLGEVELLAQGIDGRTRMGAGPLVDVVFRAGYALASLHAGRHRLTVRGDLFRNRDRIDGEYDERGWALTAAWQLSLTERTRVALEAVRVDSRRPGRYDLGVPARALDTLVQAALRIRL